MAKLGFGRIGLTDEFYAELAKKFPRNTTYVSTTRTGMILDTYDYTFTISMIVSGSCGLTTIWWDFNCEINVDFEIEKFLSAYENLIR